MVRQLEPIEERLSQLKSAGTVHWADVLDHVASEIAIGSKLRNDATKIIPGKGFKRLWPPPIKMDEAAKAKVKQLFKP